MNTKTDNLLAGTGHTFFLRLQKTRLSILITGIFLLSCGSEAVDKTSKVAPKPIAGTWKLLTGTLIEKNDTAITDYTTTASFIKIINDTHFAFLQHDLKKGKDSAVFAAGGGTYTLSDSSYTEHLEYCNAREWEGHDFTFTISIQGDTLIQKGVEQVESAGVNRLNIEKYIRVVK